MACLASLRQLVAQDWNGTAAALNLHRVSLRFRDPAQEQGFLKSRLDKLLAGLFLCACAAVALCVVSLIIMLLLWRGYDRSAFVTDAAFKLARVQMISITAACCVSLLAALAARARWLARLVGPVAYELAVVAVMSSVLCLLVLTMVWYSCKLSGQDPRDVWLGTQQHSDSTPLLVIDLFVTTANLALPIRWIILAPLEVVGIGLYVACLAIGSPDTSAVPNLAVLVCLIVVAALGKRTTELNERMAFSQLAAERVLRCGAEFQLSQLCSSGQAPRAPESTSSSESSLPTTTNTGRIFELAREDGGGMATQLREIGTLGQREHWLLGTDEVELFPDRVLGRGSFGLVLTGLFCGMPVAVKLVLDRHGDALARRVSALANELRILRQLRHTNIVFIHGAVVDVERRRVGLVLEMVQGKTVAAFMGIGPRGGQLPDHCVRYQVCLGVCRAFLYLHSRQPPIVHGDLKSANVLVEATGRGAHPKLLDFGLARVLTRNARPLGGTLAWMAPELLGRTPQPPQRSADIFSLGMLLHFVATRTHPRAGMGKHSIRRSMRRAQPILPAWPPDSAFQPHCKPLVEACLQLDAGLRPSAAEVHRAVSSWPGLRDLPGIPPDAAVVPDPSHAKSWSEAVQGLPRSCSLRAEGPQEHMSSEEGLSPALQQSLSPLQRPSRLETVEEEERHPGPSGAPAAERPEAAPRMLLPGMRQTEEGMMLWTLTETVAQWNFEVPHGSCCAWHAGVRKLQSITESLARVSCRADKDRTGVVQCLRCGILVEDGEQLIDGYICELCVTEGVTSHSAPKPERCLEHL